MAEISDQEFDALPSVDLSAPQIISDAEFDALPEAAKEPDFDSLPEAKEFLSLPDMQKQIDSGEFNPLQYAASLNATAAPTARNPAATSFDHLTSEQQQKLIDAYGYQQAKGVTLGAVTRGLKQVPSMAAGAVRGAAGLAKRIPGVTDLKGGAEAAAAVESGGLDTLSFVRRAGRKILRGLAESGAAQELSALESPPTPELTPEQIREQFFSDLGVAAQQAKAVKGQGALAELQGLDAESLKKEGIELDMQAIEDMSILTDPTNFVPAAGGLAIVNKLGKRVGFVKGAAKVEQAIEKVGRAVSRTAGKVVAAPGAALEITGQLAKKRAPMAGSLAAPTGIISGVLTGSPEVALKAAATALVAPVVIRTGGELLEQVGKQARKAGPLAERVADFTFNRAVKPAAAGGIVGGTMAVPLAMLADNDDEAASLIAGGVTFGAGGRIVESGAKDAGQALGGYLAEKYQGLNQRQQVSSPGYGTQEGLDAVHDAAIADLAKERPADANIINTVREVFRKVAAPRAGAIQLQPPSTVNAEIYLLPEDVVPPDVPGGTKPAAGFFSGVAPDGTARIYLWRDATAVFHEPGHLIHQLIKTVDPEAAKSLTDAVTTTFSEPAREAFRQAYEKRLYGDAEGRALDADQVNNEIVAESFANMLRGHSLDGLPASFRQRIATALGGFLEATGLYQPPVTAGGPTPSPLQPGEGGVSPLGVGHSFKISRMGADFLSRLGVRVPESSLMGGLVETPVRPAAPAPLAAAPVPQAAPVEPRKATREQAKEDRQLKNQPPVLSIDPGIDFKKWDEAETLLAGTPELESLKALRAAVDKPQGQVGPVRSPYFSVIEDSGQSPVERTARRMQQNIAAIREELGAVPEDLREMVFKTHIPNRVIIRQRKDGSPNVNVVGTSVEKIFVNAVLATREAQSKGITLPIDTRNGKITGQGSRQLFDALAKYTQNQMNGYAGDGSKVTVPEGYQGDVPPVNPNYTPQPLDARLSQFVNLLQGIEPPATTFRKDRTRRFSRTGRELTTPRNVEAASLARASGRPILEAINVRRGESGRPDANIFRETGETIKEFNPLRDEFAQKGVDLSKILHESIEELSLEHFGGVVEPVQSALRGVSTPLATAGFMPDVSKPPTTKLTPEQRADFINRIEAATSDTLADVTAEAHGGLTGLAYDLGLSAPDRASADQLNQLAEKWRTEGRRLMDEKKILQAMPAVMKAQLYREAFEAATDSGSAAGPSGYRRLRPGFESPFPAAPEGEISTADAIREAVQPIADAIKDALTPRTAPGTAPGTAPRIPLSDEGGAFMASLKPSPETESIKNAAIRLPDGKVFTGPTHYFALENAAEAKAVRPGPDPDSPYDSVEFESGFVTKSGRFVDRKEAARLAIETGQIDASRTDVYGPQYGLESLGFGGARRFMPRPAKKTLKKSSDLTSKGWILPNDEFIPLGAQMHHSWLQENATDLNKRFKTKFDEKTSPDERIDALNKGFTRINYERNTGTLHIETNKKYWNKRRKDTVFETVADNLDDIDNMLVNVVNDDGTIADSGYARLFNYDDAEKLNHLPLISEGGEFMPEQTVPSYQNVVDVMNIPSSVRKDFTDAARMLDEGFTKEQWEALDYGAQKRIHQIARFKSDWESPFGSNKRDRERRFPFSAKRAMSMFEDLPTFGPQDTSFVGAAPRGEGVPPVIDESMFMPSLKANVLDEIRLGQREGATLNRDGSEFNPGDRKLDVVTVASVDIPVEELSPESLQRALEPFEEIVSKEDVKPGVFRIARKGPNGEALVSIDVNALVDQKYRENTAKFAADNNQESFFDLVTFETVPSGGDGRTVLKSPTKIAKAIDLLVKGEPVDFAKLETPEMQAVFARMDQRSRARARGGRNFMRRATQEEGPFMPAPEEEAPLSETPVRPETTEGPLSEVEPTPEEAVRQRMDQRFRQRARGGRNFFRRATQEEGPFMPIPEDTEVTAALSVDKRPFVGAHRKLEPGTAVGVRIDIPAFERTGTYVQTVHEKAAGGKVGKRIGYDSIVAVDDPVFFSNERGAAKIKEGAAKFPIATVEGKFNPDRTLPEDLSEWTEVGFNPRRHSYFYEKVTDKPVVSGTKAISVGNSVFVKDAEFGNREDYLFMPEPSEVSPLEDVPVPVKPYSKKEMTTLTQKGKRARFPEAVVPRSSEDIVEYDIVDSPRYKAAKTDEAAIKDFADQLESKYNTYKDDPRVIEGSKWYSDFVPMVKEEFGDKAQQFVELLAATSPRNTPKQNFNYAVEAFDLWNKGAYDEIAAKFNEGMDKLTDGSLEREYLRAVPEEMRPKKPSAATYLAWWIEKHDLVPKRANGKLYGMHSTSVLKVLARQWLNENSGLKTRQFVNNLIGEDHGATIDMWAARTMREIAYKGFQDRWRILAENETAVKDVDFKFSQAVFAEAARRLGIEPDQLQAAMWFLEKKLWAENGWNNADYGSFVEELKRFRQKKKKA